MALVGSGQSRHGRCPVLRTPSTHVLGCGELVGGANYQKEPFSFRRRAGDPDPRFSSLPFYKTYCKLFRGTYMGASGGFLLIPKGC
jgi:hypothetical protein